MILKSVFDNDNRHREALSENMSVERGNRLCRRYSEPYWARTRHTQYLNKTKIHKIKLKKNRRLLLALEEWVRFRILKWSTSISLRRRTSLTAVSLPVSCMDMACMHNLSPESNVS